VQRVYPCHSPNVDRWFLLHASPLVGGSVSAERGAVVTHLEITPWMQDAATTPDAAEDR
jgi:hypothetical protein